MKPANTLVILSDEHQARAMSCAGHPLVKTPNLDRLAARGTRFTNAITPCPICVPARAAFATGLPVHQCGYWDNSFGYDGRVRGWGHALQEAAHSRRVRSASCTIRSKDLPTGFDAEHVPMYLYKGVGTIWGSIRDPLPAAPDGQAYAGRSHRARAVGLHALRPVDRRSRGALDRGERAASLDRPVVSLRRFRRAAFPARRAAGVLLDLYPLDKLPPAKLHPQDGYKLHPWNQVHDDFWSHETMFEDETERRTAVAAYYGLVSWLDHNVGRLMEALEESRSDRYDARYLQLRPRREPRRARPVG